jgi:hypothetical protein
MDLGSINWIAVLVAALVNFIAGFIWFSPIGFYPAWWRAIGRDPSQEPGQGQNMGAVFGMVTVAVFVQAILLALIVGVFKELNGDVSLTSGLEIGAVVGLIGAAASLGHRLFSNQGLKVWIIEVASDVLNIALMGVVFSFFY